MPISTTPVFAEGRFFVVKINARKRGEHKNNKGSEDMESETIKLNAVDAEWGYMFGVDGIMCKRSAREYLDVSDRASAHYWGELVK